MMCARVLTVGALLALFQSAEAAAQAVRRIDADLVTVRAVATPAGDVLAELLKIQPLKAVGLEPKILTPVTVSAENVTPLQAIALVLKATEFDFVLAKTLLVSRTRRVVEAPKEPPRQFREPDIAERPVPPAGSDLLPPSPPPSFPVPQ
jgi:hypothetical protein